jgi:hypothetical protein
MPTVSMANGKSKARSALRVAVTTTGSSVAGTGCCAVASTGLHRQYARHHDRSSGSTRAQSGKEMSRSSR